MVRTLIPRKTRGGDPDRLGRGRALHMYPDVQPCEACGRDRGVIDRHHRNADRLDNGPENIAFLCRRCHNAAHRALDGRIGGGPRPRIAAMFRAEAEARSIEARRLGVSGLGTAAIAAALGVHPDSVTRWFRKYPA